MKQSKSSVVQAPLHSNAKGCHFQPASPTLRPIKHVSQVQITYIQELGYQKGLKVILSLKQWPLAPKQPPLALPSTGLASEAQGMG